MSKKQIDVFLNELNFLSRRKYVPPNKISANKISANKINVGFFIQLMLTPRSIRSGGMRATLESTATKIGAKDEAKIG